MKTAQFVTKMGTVSDLHLKKIRDINPHLIFVFSSVPKLGKFGSATKLAKSFPKATVIGCSTSGEISDGSLSDDSIAVAGVHFEDPSVRIVPFMMESASAENGFEVGRKVASQIDLNGLKGIFTLTPGLNFDAGKYISGLNSVFPSANIPISGGQAGDSRALDTRTSLNGYSSSSQVVGFSIYGDNLVYETSYRGGWQPFGEPMQFTKTDGNTVLSIDGKSALEVYKKLLGSAAMNLPQSAYNYPFLVISDQTSKEGVIRTPLAIDKSRFGLMLGAAVEEGSWVRIVTTEKKDLIVAAGDAAEELVKSSATSGSHLALVVTCAGRRQALGEEFTQELDAIKKSMGAAWAISGFYSYGEISPESSTKICTLHNQTITFTHMTERLKAA